MTKNTLRAIIKGVIIDAISVYEESDSMNIYASAKLSSIIGRLVILDDRLSEDIEE